MRDFFSKVYSTAVVAVHLFGQRRVPYLPEKQLHEMRDQRLRWMVRYAADTVPYYRDLFRAEKIDPADIRTVADLQRLPLIDKEVVRQQPERFRSTSKWGKEAVPFITSGTTGTPLTIFHDRDSLVRDAAFREREREALRGLLGRRYGYRVLSFSYAGSTVDTVKSFLRGARFLPAAFDRMTLSISDPLEEVVSAINRHRPDVIEGYGSYLEALFKTVVAHGIPMHLPKVVFYTADAMTDGGKHLIKEQLDIPILSAYNAVETFKIGFLCAEDSGFHLHEDLTHIEIVDAHGHRVAKGEKGEVVISNLVNRSTVLLNYRLGDIAALADERCPCGLTLRLLTGLEGRVEDVVYLPDGRFVHPRSVWKVFKFRPEVLQYQLIQHALDLLELKLVTVDRATFERVSGEIVAELRQLLGPSATIEAAYHERLETTGRPKFRPVLSLVKQKR